MKSQIEILFSLQSVCEIHFLRMNEAILYIKNLFPIT